MTTESSKLIIRMSGSGDCPRAMTADLSGKYKFTERAKPSWLETSAEEGKKHEIWIKEELEDKGFCVFDEQLELRIEFPEFILLGHIDGKCNHEDKPWINELLEIKSMSEYEFQRWARGKFSQYPYYASQLACYATATELQNIRYIVKNRSSGYKETLQLNWDTFPVKEEFTKVVNNCKMIVDCIDHDKLPEIEYDGDTLQCRRCSFDKLCIRETSDLQTIINNKELIEATTRYREAIEKVEEYEELVKIQKDIFKTQLEASGISKIMCNQLILQLITVKPRVDYNKRKLISLATGEQLLQSAVQKEGYTYLLVSDKTKEKMAYKKNEED